MRRLRIPLRLMLSFGFMVLLLGVGSALALWQIDSMHSEAHQVRQSSAQMTALINVYNEILAQTGKDLLGQTGQDLLATADMEVKRAQTRAIEDMANARHHAFLILIITGSLGLIAAALLGGAITQSIAKPLGQLEAGVKALTQGNLNYQISSNGRDELTRLSLVFNDMTARLRELINCLEKNVADLKETEKALRASEERYRIIVETAGEGIWVIGTNARPTFVNRQMADMLGCCVGEIYGKRVFDFLDEENAAIFREKLERRKQGIGEQYDLKFRCADGSELWAVINDTPIFDADGKVRNCFGLVTDVTKRKQAEAELERYHNHLEELVAKRTHELEEKAYDLEQANLRLQEADRLKSIFLASMSHELRTPLNSIIGFTGILLMGMSGQLNEEQRKQIKMVKSSANHLLSLINDLLDIARIEAGRAEVSPAMFSLDDVLEEIRDTFSPAISEKGLNFIVNVPTGITLFSDERRFKQILINLVSNAIKFTNQGDISISIEIQESQILWISVADTGIGIKKGEMGRLFQPFQQVDSSLTKRYEGTGLGLYLSKKLLDLLDGDIQAESEFGKGSRFSFTIPVRLES